MTGCWRGEVEQVIEVMQSFQQEIGEPPGQSTDRACSRTRFKFDRVCHVEPHAVGTRV